MNRFLEHFFDLTNITLGTSNFELKPWCLFECKELGESKKKMCISVYGDR
jgi:hypothetical protein